MAIETYFKNIANAIRSKSGSSGTFTPSQMPQAILNLPTGSGGLMIPVIYQLSYGYIANDGHFYANTERSASLSFYDVKASDKVLMYLPDSSSANRNRYRIQYYNRPYTDFTEYINNAHTNEAIYNCYLIIAQDSNPYPPNYGTIYKYTVPYDGTIIIATSNQGELFPAICVLE